MGAPKNMRPRFVEPLEPPMATPLIVCLKILLFQDHFILDGDHKLHDLESLDKELAMQDCDQD